MNWHHMLLRLSHDLGSQRAVAEALDCPVATVRAYYQQIAKEPFFGLGVRILALYSQRIEPVPGAVELAAAVKKPA